MTRTNTPHRQRFVAMLGRPMTFRFILALLVVQAAWIALSGRYPMAFDEDFHLGIIRLYAHHLSPFWSSQPAGADGFGAVARDPSYLYQYLMSFPYRLISLFTSDQTIQVLILRVINIGLFTSGLVLYRRLLLKTGASKALVQICLLVLVLIPIVPLLAAQINYDNLLLPMTALALLLAVKFDKKLAKHKRPDSKTLLQLLTVCLLASLVKYAFLPIFVAIIGFVAVRVWQRRHSLPKPWLGLLVTWRALSGWLRVGLLLAVLVATGLFVERYGVNLVRYHTPAPTCSQVLTIKQCNAYGPWARDYTDTLTNSGGPHSRLTFTHEWLYGLWLRTFFAVDGPGTQFQTRGPLLLPGLGAIAFAAVGVLAVLVSAPRLLRKHSTPIFWLFVAVSLCYTAALWQDEYKAFVQTGQPVAINGRYLLPVLPLGLLIVAMALREACRRHQALKLGLTAAAVVCLVWGGGALTYILRSNDAWYWPNPTVRTVNHAVQRALGPLTPGYDQPTLFLR